MSEHSVTLVWKNTGSDFSYEKYTREHEWQFPGGIRVTATAAPEYLGKKEFVNPEEGFIASLASCHMLTFLAIASKKSFVVESYRDRPVGILGKDAQGRMCVTEVTLNPEICFAGEKKPEPTQLAAMHEKAHEYCFIANSVKTEVKVKQ